MTKVTIEDISRHTGLSRGTVSRALNNRPDISEQTKQRVLDACRQLNYVPSHAARSLATGRCYAVVVGVDDLHNTFAADFVRGVIAAALPERYAVHVVEFAISPEAALQSLASFAKERVDSVIAATSLPAGEAASILEASGMRPLVSVEPIEGVLADVLAPDYVESGRLVARRVLQQAGHDFVYIYDGLTPRDREQAEGVAEVCRQNNLAPEAVMVDLQLTSGTLDGMRDRVLASRGIGCGNDLLAAQALLLCREVGRLPGVDVWIIGQGNHPLTEALSPQLTTVDYCGEEIGRRSFNTSLQRVLKVRQDTPTVTLIAPRVIERQT